MRLTIDLKTPLQTPRRDICTIIAEVAKNLELSYNIPRKIIGVGDICAESRYNEKMVKKQYTPGSLVHVLQNTHLYGDPSKLTPRFSGLCNILKVGGLTLTLRELDSNTVFTASPNAVRVWTLSRPKAPLQAEPVA